MKIKSLLSVAFGALLIMGSVSCNDDTTDDWPNGGGQNPGVPPVPFPDVTETFVVSFNENPIEDNLDLSFVSKTPESYGIYVESSQAWTVDTGENPWLDIELRDDGFVLSAQRNRQRSTREAVVTISSGGVTKTVTATQAKPRVIVYNVDPPMVGGNPGITTSANGRYVVGGSSTLKWVVDLDQITPDLTGEYAGQDVIVVDADITKFIFGSPEGTYGYSSSVSNYGESYEHGQTADGIIRVNATTVASHSTPYFIQNGNIHFLPAPPEIQIGTTNPHKGYQPMGISSDGKYIYGVHNNFRGGFFECGWSYNETTGNYDYKFYPDKVMLTEYNPDAENPELSHDWVNQAPRPYTMSRNGKWTAGLMRTLYAEVQTPDANYSYWRDTETGEINIINTLGSARQPTVITNDGLVGLGGSGGVYITTFYDVNTGETTEFLDWAAETFDINDPQSYIGDYLVRGMSEDNTTVVLTYQYSQNMNGTQIITVE